MVVVPSQRSKSVHDADMKRSSVLSGRAERRCQGSKDVVADITALLERQSILPERLRPMAWQRLLGLPGNTEAFECLVARGTHSAGSKLCSSFPLRGVAAARLRILVSALAHWCPILAQLSYLPAFVFPVTQVFRADHLSAFEFGVTLFMNWAHDWLDSFPGPPIGMLSRAIALLKYADPELYLHCQKCMAVSDFADSLLAISGLWPILQSLLSEVLPRLQWLALWDFIVARWKTTDLLIAVTVVLLRERRSFLLAVPHTQQQQLLDELRKSHECPSVRGLIMQAEKLLSDSGTLAGIGHNMYVLPLPSGVTYPLLTVPCAAPVNTLSDMSFMRPEAFGPCNSRLWDRKLCEATTHLDEAVAQFEEQCTTSLRERDQQHAQTLEDIDRLSDKRDLAEAKVKAIQVQCMERLSRGVGAVLRFQSSSHERALGKIEDELRIRRERRALDVEQMIKHQNGLELEEQAAHETREKLRDQLMEIESGHVQKLADARSKECDLLSDLRKQQMETFNMRTRIHAETEKATRDERERLRDFAGARRKAEADVYLQSITREFELGKHMTDSTVDHVKAAAEVFEDDASRLHHQRYHLSKVSEARNHEQQKTGWQEHDNERAKLWKAEQSRDGNYDQFRRYEENDVFLSSARLHARSQIWRDVTKDAIAAQLEEDRFREALLGLDDIRR